MMEGSGSVLVTNGSGSEGLKHADPQHRDQEMRLRRILVVKCKNRARQGRGGAEAYCTYASCVEVLYAVKKELF
jgi:hypothetical protein